MTQVQTSIEQVQQTADKLSKGFRPRPAGYPPGQIPCFCLCPTLVWMFASTFVKQLLQGSQQGVVTRTLQVVFDIPLPHRIPFPFTSCHA